MKARHIYLHHRSRKKLNQLKLEAFKDGALRVAKRFEAVLLNNDGYTSGEISKKLKVSLSRVSQWLKTYEEQGVEGLYEGKRSGRPCDLTDLQKILLCDIIDSGSVAYGLSTGIWTSPIIRDVIKSEFGVNYHEGHVRKLLYEFGFSVQRPKHLLIKADKEKKAKWLKETYPEIKKKSIATVLR